MNQYDLEANTTLIEAGMLTGMMPIACEGAHAIMLTNGVRAIFVPSNKELSFEQKVVAMKTLATARGLDPEFYVEDALRNPSHVDHVVARLYSGVVGKFRKEHGASNNDPTHFTAMVETISRNNEYLQSIARQSGFDSEMAQAMASNVNEAVKSLHYMMDGADRAPAE